MSRKTPRILRYFIGAFLPTALLVVLSIWYLKHQDDHLVMTRLHASQEMAVGLGRASLTRHLEAVRRDLAYVTSYDGLRNLISAESPERLWRVIRDAMVLSNTSPIYDQIRWIDETGMERVRVDRRDGIAVPISSLRLQNKAARYYFTDTMALVAGSVFMSPLDLNVEGDAIELPYKPMLRFATPVTDHNGRRRGIVILNYLAKELLDDLANSSSGFVGRRMLLNGEGYWLKGGSAEQEWGFMLNRQNTLATRDPEVWSRMLDADRGRISAGSGLWTWHRLYPLQPDQSSSTGNANAAGVSHGRILDRDYKWIVVSHMPALELAALLTQSNSRYATIAGILLALLAVGSWGLALALEGRAKAHEALERFAVTDALTGLLNRRALMEAAERELARARRSGTPLAVLMLDLDHFKGVNDEFGHQAGDRVLVEFAAAARSCLRAEDLIGRYGGEEFCAVLPGATAGQARAIAERIRLAVCERPLGGLPRATTISVGVAVCPPGESFVLGAAIARADEALYQAKAWGRNRVVALPLSAATPRTVPARKTPTAEAA